MKNHAQLVLRGIYRKRVLQALLINESCAMNVGTDRSAGKTEHQYSRRTSGKYGAYRVDLPLEKVPITQDGRQPIYI